MYGSVGSCGGADVLGMDSIWLSTLPCFLPRSAALALLPGDVTPIIPITPSCALVSCFASGNICLLGYLCNESVTPYRALPLRLHKYHCDSIDSQRDAQHLEE